MSTTRGASRVDRVRVPKTADIVASALRRDIIRNELYDNDRMPTEAELMERFGVSRPSLREALRVLESEHLVEVRRGNQGGVRARRPSVAVAANYLGLVMQAERVTLADVYGARTAIEPQAVRMITESRNRRRAVAELRALVEEERQVASDEPERYAAAVTRFHQRLVELSDNKALALVWGTLQHVLAGEVRDLGVRFSPAQRARRADELDRAIDLIESGDAEAAESHWRTQLMSRTRKVVERHGGKTVVDVLGD